MFSGVGFSEIMIVLVVALIIFGPKRLPEAGRSLGRGLREFKDSIVGGDRDELDAPSTSAPAATPRPAATTSTEAGGDPSNLPR